MNDYITIKEAADLTGKHPDTIRALIRKHKEKTARNPQGKVLINSEFIVANYSIDLKALADTEQTANTAPDPSQAAYNPTEQAEQASPMDSLIKALTDELQAKNDIIKQQQETIQKIVDQQQQLTGMLMGSNQQLPEKAGIKAPNSDNSTSVNPIEEKANKEKAIKEKDTEGKGLKGKTHKKTKKHWWNR